MVRTEVLMTSGAQAVLDAVVGRLEREPARVLPWLRLIADDDRLPAAEDRETVRMARRLNTERLAAARHRFADRSLTTAEVAALLGGVTRQAVSARVRAGRLLAVQLGGTLRFPDWQFGPEGPYVGLPALMTELCAQGRGGLAADALMRAPIDELAGRTPADLLAAGDSDGARWWVRAAGEIG